MTIQILNTYYQEDLMTGEKIIIIDYSTTKRNILGRIKEKNNQISFSKRLESLKWHEYPLFNVAVPDIIQGELNNLAKLIEKKDSFQEYLKDYLETYNQETDFLQKELSETYTRIKTSATKSLNIWFQYRSAIKCESDRCD